MFPASFDYFRAGSIQEAIGLLARHADAKVLAGGHSLIPMMKLRLAQPSAVIDIGRIDALRGIERRGDRLHVGALATHGLLARSPVVREQAPLVAEVAGKIADLQVRNRGTIGGNIAHADPASDWPAALLALDGRVHVAGPGGERTIPAAQFFTGLLTTDLQPSEIITAIDLATSGPGSGAAYLKLEHPASGYAVCGAAALVSLGAHGACTAARLCFNGVAPVAFEASGASALVGGNADDGSIDAALAQLAIDDPLDDAQFSGEYRAAIAKVYGVRALRLARDRARS
jgi:carbon-monoxide dehydrogenase medium subunit